MQPTPASAFPDYVLIAVFFSVLAVILAYVFISRINADLTKHDNRMDDITDRLCCIEENDDEDDVLTERLDAIAETIKRHAGVLEGTRQLFFQHEEEWDQANKVTCDRIKSLEEHNQLRSKQMDKIILICKAIEEERDKTKASQSLPEETKKSILASPEAKAATKYYLAQPQVDGNLHSRMKCVVTRYGALQLVTGWPDCLIKMQETAKQMEHLKKAIDSLEQEVALTTPNPEPTLLS